MSKDELKKEILRLLKTSSLSQHDKNMVEILLSSMKDDKLQSIYNSLMTEHSKMAKLDEKKKRIELKYQVMVDGLTKSKKYT